MSGDLDRKYMALALTLAEKGRGTTSPNPMVGAVIVKDGEIIGRGWHEKAGGPHAEVTAIAEAGEQARGATMYVTLEPCSHQGRTPPCTDAIIASGFSRVVAAMTDENPQICGAGCTRLREAGIEVETGVLEPEARKLNEAFLKYITTGLPFVTVKLATTLDGFIADCEGKSKWITGSETRKFVHRLRAMNDAVMVGSGTVSADNPSLNVRDAEGGDPVRVLVDSKLMTQPDAKALGDGNVVLAVTEDAGSKARTTHTKHSIEVWTLPSDRGRVHLKSLLEKLGRREIMSVLCEGGAGLASSLISEGLADKMIFTVAPKLLGKGLSALRFFDPGGIGNALELTDVEHEIIGNDVVIAGYPNYN